jgi:hypothetical protein
MSRYFYEQRRRRQEEERRLREQQSAGGTGSDLLNPLNPLSPAFVFVGADYSNNYSTGSSDSCGSDSGSCSSD